MAGPANDERSSRKGGRGGPGGGPRGGPRLIPEVPLSGWVAFLQVAVLLGLPIGLLILVKIILRLFFPDLGY